MNMNMINGILRALVPAGVAYAVGRGWLSESSAASVAAAIIAIGSAGWSIHSNTPSSTLSQASAIPEVKQIIVTPTTPSSAVGIAASDSQQPKIVSDASVKGN